MARQDNRNIQWDTKMVCTVIVLCWITCDYVVLATTCYKEESLGDREGNVYLCEEGGKSECCQENNEYTCCETQAEKSWREQLILWGTVGGLVLVISLLCCYFWRDNVCSKSETSLTQSCCTCCRKQETEEQKHLPSDPEPGSSKPSRFSPRPWRFPGQGISDDDRNSPAPAFHFKQPTYKKY